MSGGIGLTSLFGNGYSNEGIPKSYIMNLEYRQYLSESFAIRFFTDLNFFGNGNDDLYSEGGNKNLFVITFDGLVGDISSAVKTKQYFTFGIGAFVFNETDETYTNYGVEFTHQGESFTFAGLKIGYGFDHNLTPKTSLGSEILYFTPFEELRAGILSAKTRLSFKASKSIDVFLEPQYSFPVYIGENGGFFVENGYFTFKTGLSYNF